MGARLDAAGVLREMMKEEDMDELANAQVSKSDGHSGFGWYAWAESYPEDGSFFFGEERPTEDQLAEVGLTERQ